MLRTTAVLILTCALRPGGGLSTAMAGPPRMLFQHAAVRDPGAAGGARTGFAVLRLPDGSFAFYNRNAPAAGPLQLPDGDGQLHTLLPHLPKEILTSEVILNSGVLDNTQVVLMPDGTVVSVTVRNESLDRQTAAQVGLPRYLNVWFQQADRRHADAAKMIWRGYNGSQMEYQQLSSGRLLVPHGSFIPHARAVPPHGRHRVVIEYSDDGGRTWKLSPTELSSPCYPGFNGSNEGACEPAIEELRDGRLWMLMRTQAGFLYESFSPDNGTTWTSARASRFSTSTGPPNIMRHRNGWLVVCWNNCELPRRHEGEGVYGGRDALHIAVSDDDGRTWRGFREIYLDHRRNDNPARSGDRGTAYPLAAFTRNGTIVVIAGQGEGGRNPILIDPKWVTATSAQTDFTDGLEQWSVYKHYGPARRWWRARAAGCDLTASPTSPGKRCLHVRKPDGLPADGAVWNFPNGWKGSLTIRLRNRHGSHGGLISLTDRFFDPSSGSGEEFAVFQAVIDRNGRVGSATLPADEWAILRFDWDLSQSQCQLTVNGQPAGTLPVRHQTLNGLSYLRLRSAADEIDTAGFLVDRVSVTVHESRTPPCGPQDLRAHEQRYIEKVVSTWTTQERR